MEEGRAARDALSQKRAGPFLVLSSLFFMQPMALASCFSVHDGPTGFVSVWCTFVTLVSMCYWVKPEPGWRLSLDIMVARSSFFIVLIAASVFGEAHMHGVRLVAMLNGAVAVAFYALSCHLFSLESPYWRFSHASMHFTGGLNMAICEWIMCRSRVRAPTPADVPCGLGSIDVLFSGLNDYFAQGALDGFFGLVSWLFANPWGYMAVHLSISLALLKAAS